MKIKEMSDGELSDAMQWMSVSHTEDEHFSNFNFDSTEWKDKFLELINESITRRNNVSSGN